jgi:D-arabinose 5-phosphate isomerase GutQ
MGEKSPCYSKLNCEGISPPWIPSGSPITKSVLMVQLQRQVRPSMVTTHESRHEELHLRGAWNCRPMHAPTNRPTNRPMQVGRLLSDPHRWLRPASHSLRLVLLPFYRSAAYPRAASPQIRCLALSTRQFLERPARATPSPPMGSLPAPASAECAPRPQGRATVAASDLAPLFSAQRRHLDHFFDRLDMAQAAAFAQALLDAPGAVFFTGVGKSGIVARKTAQTLASLGLARAGFLAPVDALHGDIGALFPGDVLVILSKSGASDELLALAPCARAKGAYLVSLTSAASGDDCPLAAACDLNVHLPLQGEVCPFGLAPVTSTAIQMVFGDTVIAAIMEARRLSRDQYASNHPAGKIGKTLIFKVIKSTTSNPNINRLPALLQLLFLETFNYLVPTHSVGHRIPEKPDALSLLGFLHRVSTATGMAI